MRVMKKMSTRLCDSMVCLMPLADAAQGRAAGSEGSWAALTRQRKSTICSMHSYRLEDATRALTALTGMRCSEERKSRASEGEERLAAAKSAWRSRSAEGGEASKQHKDTLLRRRMSAQMRNRLPRSKRRKTDVKKRRDT